MNEQRVWRVTCLENQYPGMWHRWLKNHCVAVGWPPGWGFSLTGKTKDRGWSRARNALREVKTGDFVYVALAGRRIGRIGEVTGKAIQDHQWNPLVPLGAGLESGEMGRRVFVRWDL